MILDKATALKTAELLLQINAIKLRPENPYKWASGWSSPIYCDNRIILSYPEIRTYVRDMLVKGILKQYPDVEVIAGVATGAIGMGALVAQAMDLPFIYVRPEPKSHGRKNQIEGKLQENARVVVIEDLISTGKSSLNAVKALREQKSQILGMLAVFTYGFDIAQLAFESAEVELYTLSDYEHTLGKGSESGYVREEELELLREWRRDPSAWQPITS